VHRGEGRHAALCGPTGSWNWRSFYTKGAPTAVLVPAGVSTVLEERRDGRGSEKGGLNRKRIHNKASSWAGLED
jgi:hypothetical protein